MFQGLRIFSISDVTLENLDRIAGCVNGPPGLGGEIPIVNDFEPNAHSYSNPNLLPIGSFSMDSKKFGIWMNQINGEVVLFRSGFGFATPVAGKYGKFQNLSAFVAFWTKGALRGGTIESPSLKLRQTEDRR